MKRSKPMPFEAWVCVAVFVVCLVLKVLPSTVNDTVPNAGLLISGILGVYFASRPLT